MVKARDSHQVHSYSTEIKRQASMYFQVQHKHVCLTGKNSCPECSGQDSLHISVQAHLQVMIWFIAPWPVAVDLLFAQKGAFQAAQSKQIRRLHTQALS